MQRSYSQSSSSGMKQDASLPMRSSSRSNSRQSSRLSSRKSSVAPVLAGLSGVVLPLDEDWTTSLDGSLAWTPDGVDTKFDAFFNLSYLNGFEGPKFPLGTNELQNNEEIQPEAEQPYQVERFEQLEQPLESFVDFFTYPPFDPNNPTMGPLDPIQQTLATSSPMLPPQLTASTPGLTAFPGGSSIMMCPPVPYQYGTTYPDSQAPMCSQLPYCFSGQIQPQCYYQQQPEYIPIDPLLRNHVQKQHKSVRPLTKRKHDVVPNSEEYIPLSKRRREQSIQSEQDNSDIEDGTYKRTECVVISPHRGSDISSAYSDIRKPIKIAARQGGQLPQRVDSKPWIRINNNTKGETTRTARINEEAQEQRKYRYKPLPHGKWKSAKHTFDYIKPVEHDELNPTPMSGHRIFEYITQYPSNDLRIWIQVTPADVIRRYGSAGHSRCIFEKCPKRDLGESGTIEVGTFRVAFDEKFKKYSNSVVDPFDCTGFAHLYCMERFLNFKAICEVADVQADTRVNLPCESSQAKWSLSGRPELDTVKYFIRSCKKGILHTTPEFKHYPSHDNWDGEPKVHDSTLTHAIVSVNIETRTRSQMHQFVNREITPKLLLIHRGDLDLSLTKKKIERSASFKNAIRKGKTTKRDYDFEARYDRYDPQINIRIAECRTLKAQYAAEEASGIVAKNRRRGFVKQINRTQDDSESEDFDVEHNFDDEDPTAFTQKHSHAPTCETRSSPRKQRLDYIDVSKEPFTRLRQRDIPIPGYAPAAQQPTTVPQIYQPLSPTCRESCSQFFYQDPKYDLDNLLGLSRRKSTATSPIMPTTPLESPTTPLSLSSGSGISPRTMIAPRTTRSQRQEARRAGQARKGRARQASFALQPVSVSKEFWVGDPPSAMGSGGASGSLRRRSSKYSVAVTEWS